jgi:hypothetical protein
MPPPGFGGAGGSTYMIEWRTDISDPNTAFNSNGYSYSNSSRTLFLVDPANPAAIPTGMKASVTLKPAAKFKVGDKVRLLDGCCGSSLVPSNSHLSENSENCLGTESSGRVGVIINVKKELFTETKTRGARRFAPGEEDHVVTVMSVYSGVQCDYASSDLRYADGSAPGKNITELEPPPVGNYKNKSLLPVVSGGFKSGDRVRLRKNATDLNGCLGDPSDKWVGVIGGGGGFGGGGFGAGN